MLSVIMCSSSLVLTSFIERNSTLLFFSYSLLYGFGISMLYASCVYATTKYFRKRQNAAFGILISGYSIGMLTLGPLLQFLLDRFGLKTTLRIMAGSLFLPILLTFDTNVNDGRVTDVQENNVFPERNCMLKLFVIFKRPAYIIAIVTIFLQCFTANMATVHLVSNVVP